MRKVSGWVRTEDILVLRSPSEAEGHMVKNQRVPSKGQSRSVSQQPGSEWQSELAKTELRANFNRKKNAVQEISMQLEQEERGWKRLGGKESAWGLDGEQTNGNWQRRQFECKHWHTCKQQSEGRGGGGMSMWVASWCFGLERGHDCRLRGPWGRLFLMVTWSQSWFTNDMIRLVFRKKSVGLKKRWIVHWREFETK